MCYGMNIMTGLYFGNKRCAKMTSFAIHKITVRKIEHLEQTDNEHFVWCDWLALTI